MREFVCKFANERGQILKQVESAASESEMRARLAQQGFYIYSVKPRTAAGWFSISGSNESKKIKLSEFLIFNQQFVTLIKAGLPILKALELLGEHIAQPTMRTKIKEIREEVKGGALLSEAFRNQGVFPEIYTTSVMAGEKSGNLGDVLVRYITYQKTALSLKKKLISSLVYPTLLITLVLIMITFLVSYVIPNFAQLYNTLSQELPPMTRALIAFSDAFQEYWIGLMIVTAGTVAGLWTWSKSDAGGKSLDRAKAKFPIAGEIWTKYQVAQFSRILGTLLAGGIPMVQALDTARQSVSSALLRQALENAKIKVQGGKALWEGLSETGFFPGMAIEMIQVGESSGALAPMLASVAEFFEEDVSNYMSAALSLIEPVILLFMGVVVALVLIALYLPIFSMAGSL